MKKPLALAGLAAFMLIGAAHPDLAAPSYGDAAVAADDDLTAGEVQEIDGKKVRVVYKRKEEINFDDVLIRHLIDRGLAVMSFDLPGHGRSSSTVFSVSATKATVEAAVAACADRWRAASLAGPVPWPRRAACRCSRGNEHPRQSRPAALPRPRHV